MSELQSGDEEELAAPGDHRHRGPGGGGGAHQLAGGRRAAGGVRAESQAEREKEKGKESQGKAAINTAGCLLSLISIAEKMEEINLGDPSSNKILLVCQRETQPADQASNERWESSDCLED